MDRAAYVHQRKGKYMAQALEALEEMVVDGLGAEQAAEVRAYRDARDRPANPDKRAFQRHIEPLLPADVVRSLTDFKALVRARFNALATDAVEIMSLSDAGGLNGVALEMRDALSPVGRP